MTDPFKEDVLKVLVPIVKGHVDDAVRRRNRTFMAYGPGEEWERWKTANQKQEDEVALLRRWLENPEA